MLCANRAEVSEMMRSLERKSCRDSNRSALFTYVCCWPESRYRDAAEIYVHGGHHHGGSLAGDEDLLGLVIDLRVLACDQPQQPLDPVACTGGHGTVA